MAFKVPDSARKISVVGNFGTVNTAVPQATSSNEKAAVFNHFVNFGSNYVIDNFGDGRFLGFTNLDLTNTSSIDVSIMLSTPTNPLGATSPPQPVPAPLVPYINIVRAFGDPRDTTPFLTPTTAIPDVGAKTNRISAASIKFKFVKQNINTPGNYITASGVVINTAPLAPGVLDPASPFRSFSPYTITVPPTVRTSNVALYVYQESTTPLTNYGATAGIPAIPIPQQVPVPIIIPSARTGYGWAVNRVDLGPENGGVYNLESSKNFLQYVNPGPGYTPSNSPLYTLFFYTSKLGTEVNANAFIDTAAITVDPNASFTKYFDNNYANTSGLSVSDKISFTNTSVNENRGMLLNSWQQNYNFPYRGTLGYIGKTGFDVGSTVSYTTKFNFANETWSSIRLPTSAIDIRNMAGNVVAAPLYQKNSALPLVPLYNTPTAGSAWFDQLYTWGYFYGTSVLAGHSSTHGYEVNITAIGGQAEPVPVLIAQGSDPVTATTNGTVPAANRIRGNVIRFPFANYIDFAEIADTNPAAVSVITWSGTNDMYIYGGHGQPVVTYPTFYGITDYAGVPIGNSYKIPFATTATVTVAATGTGFTAGMGTAATSQDYAYVQASLYNSGTSPATTDGTPLIYTSIATDTAVWNSINGYVGVDPAQAPSSTYTASAVRRMQKFPFAAETFTDFGDLANFETYPVFAYGTLPSTIASAASDSAVYIENEFRAFETGLRLDTFPFLSNQYVRWAKFPFAATTSITGDMEYGGQISGKTPTDISADFGIKNTQSPEYAYSLNRRFNFSSQTSTVINTDLFTAEGVSLTAGSPTENIQKTGAFYQGWSGAINIS